jgi:hypothetical protein
VLALRCCLEEIHKVTECLFALDMLADQLQEVTSDLEFSKLVCVGIVDGSYMDYIKLKNGLMGLLEPYADVEIGELTALAADQFDVDAAEETDDEGTNGLRELAKTAKLAYEQLQRVFISTFELHPLLGDIWWAKSYGQWKQYFKEDTGNRRYLTAIELTDLLSRPTSTFLQFTLDEIRKPDGQSSLPSVQSDLDTTMNAGRLELSIALENDIEHVFKLSLSSELTSIVPSRVI